MAETKFEDAMKRLEDIVRNLESGDLSLEDSLAVFEEGMKLAGFCSKKLEEVEQKVTMLTKGGDGEYVDQPFDVKENGET